MADYGLMVGFGLPVRGREEEHGEGVLWEAVQLWTRLQEVGTIQSWDAIFLEPPGGELAGFFLIWGATTRRSRASARATTSHG